MDTAGTAVEFRWMSTLGFSVLLFLFSGCFRVAIGVLTPPLHNSGIGGPAMIMSNRADRQYFGSDPGELLAEGGIARKYRTLLLMLIAGLLVAGGIGTMGIAWFGLRTGHWWSLAVLGCAGVAELPFWYLFFRPYLQAGVRITLADIPPFITVPELLLIPALILGFVGLKQL